MPRRDEEQDDFHRHSVTRKCSESPTAWRIKLNVAACTTSGREGGMGSCAKIFHC